MRADRRASLQALARPDGLPPPPGGWRTPLAATLRMFAQRHSARRDAAVRALPAHRRPAVGRARRPRRELGPVRSHGAGRDQRAVAVRRVSRFASTSRAPVPPPWLRYWRGPVLSRFDGREWTMATAAAVGAFTRPDGAPVDLHRHARAALEAVAVRARPAREPPASDRRTRTMALRHRRQCACCTRDQQIIARIAGHAAAALPADVEPAQRLSGDGGPTSNARSTENLRIAATAGRLRIRGPARSRASCGERIPDDAGYIDAVLAMLQQAVVLLHAWRRRCSATIRWTASCSTRAAASASTTRAPSSCCCARPASRRASSPATRAATINPNGGYMIVRQSRRARVGRGARSAGNGAASIRRPRSRRRGSRSGWAARCRRAIRSRCSRASTTRLPQELPARRGMRSTTTGAATSIGFNFDRQRALWREWKLDRAGAVADHRHRHRDRRGRGSARCSAGSRGAAAAQDRARALWDVDVRAARARRIAALPHEGPVDLRRRAPRRAGRSSAGAFAHHRRLVRGAALRAGRPRTPTRRSSGRRRCGV